uniref:Uncharacterized protein n=1 Tax=Chromera velia CCMP2878 TaxID=1169474 RepID=A0A0G4I682_9ALVE|eukprot:Cvel_1893.t1-p1 / transcript=Cvel_1893.t1 / gene=Cvel_1893 / organism=Chromera_velia_CCMP2878 / gene_product=Flocculation protein FLO11, putative / transcript_product=Flocculation protein FLO11, putative / location=Cvel_scaffold70:145693-148288(-) / protein_length=825 / sequence_SO=supercontig / SO=protein_coding / is_pseudo=false
MKFLAVPAAFALAAANPMGVTYSCPAGYQLNGHMCTTSESAPLQTQQVPQTITVAPVSSCPAGYSASGSSCVMTRTQPMIAERIPLQVPMTSCPSGTSGPNAAGMCTSTRMIRVPSVKSRDVPVTSTHVEREPFSVPVTKQVSVAGAPTCPSGSTMQGGACIVTGSSTDYSTEEIPTTLRFPVNTPVSSTACPSGTQDSMGSCVARLSFQSVEQGSSARTVRIPTLSSRPATYNLPASTLKTGSTCPQGTNAQADGTCTVTLRTSSLESYEVPVSSQIPKIESFPQTLTLTRQHLVPSYSCPPGSTASGSGASMTCTVTLPSASPTTSSVPRTMKKARFEKRPVEVTVNRIESFPVYYCPEGTTETPSGECAVTVTIRSPITTSETHTMCPAGAEEYNPGQMGTASSKGFSTMCKEATTVSVPATLIPGSSKGAATYACPEGTTPMGEGASMSCSAPSYQEVPMQTFTTTSIDYQTSTVTETVPKLYRYETRTITETATTEQVVTVFDEVTLSETKASLVTSSYTETVPAIMSYSVASTSETVTVTNDRVSMESCSTDAATCSFSGPNGMSACCLTETKYRVVTDTYEQAVPAVSTYFTEEVSETQTVEETFQTFDTTTLSETSHSVSTDYNTESVSPNNLVTYSTSYETQSCGSGFGFGSGFGASSGGFACDTEIVSRSVPITESVPSIPTFTTQSIQETASSERISTSASKSTMRVSEMGFEMESRTESVPAETTYRTEFTTSHSCPAGTTQSGSSCISTETAAPIYSCPHGSSASSSLSASSGCTRTTFTTVSSCPKGFEQSGSSCLKSINIPATPNMQFSH